MSDQTRHDPRRFAGGGDEYAPRAPHSSSPSEAHRVSAPREPVMRPAPQGYAPQAYASPPAPESWGPPAQSYAPESPAPAPAPQPPADSRTVTLSKGYRAHDLDDVRTIRFREPTGREYRKFGVPFRYAVTDGASAETSLIVQMDIVANYIVCLSEPAIPMSTVDRMTIEDMNACSRVITDFFK